MNQFVTPDPRATIEAAEETLMKRLRGIRVDLLDVPSVGPDVLETTGLGAAALAGLAIGWFDGADAIVRAWRPERVFAPEMSADRRRGERDKWRRAVEQA